MREARVSRQRQSLSRQWSVCVRAVEGIDIDRPTDESPKCQGFTGIPVSVKPYQKLQLCESDSVSVMQWNLQFILWKLGGVGGRGGVGQDQRIEKGGMERAESQSASHPPFSFTIICIFIVEVGHRIVESNSNESILRPHPTNQTRERPNPEPEPPTKCNPQSLKPQFVPLPSPLPSPFPIPHFSAFVTNHESRRITHLPISRLVPTGKCSRQVSPPLSLANAM